MQLRPLLHPAELEAGTSSGHVVELPQVAVLYGSYGGSSSVGAAGGKGAVSDAGTTQHIFHPVHGLMPAEEFARLQQINSSGINNFTRGEQALVRVRPFLSRDDYGALLGATLAGALAPDQIRFQNVQHQDEEVMDALEQGVSCRAVWA